MSFFGALIGGKAAQAAANYITNNTKHQNRTKIYIETYVTQYSR